MTKSGTGHSNNPMTTNTDQPPHLATRTSPRQRPWPSALTMALMLAHLPLLAFPPAPHHLIYGLVRDEYGNPLATDKAEIILETTGRVAVRARLLPGLGPGENYQLAVPMDSGITRDLYQPTALQPSVSFRLKVRIGSVTYLPIEMATDFSKLGQPGQKTRLNLTLGEDADGDGIPDAWERVLLAQQGQGGSLSDIRPDDDSDGDGLSNLSEYISGSYAFDPKDGFTLKAVDFGSQGALLEFLAIRGRTYTIYGTPDFSEWKPMEFTVPAEADQTPRRYYQATDVRPMRVAVVGESSMRFFKLMVE